MKIKKEKPLNKRKRKQPEARNSNSSSTVSNKDHGGFVYSAGST